MRYVSIADTVSRMTHTRPTHHVPAPCTEQVVPEAGLGGGALAERAGAVGIRLF